jgi:GH24 family phage-related lysozyme (muramidase)
MQVNAAGIALIKLYEGFRARAYQDSVGVWTIGFGHTSAAGLPYVKPDLQITRTEAERILSNDIGQFSVGIRHLVAGVDLNDNQFSALVSFAYNVGLGNFRKSSVYRAVMSGDFMAVPRRLALWIKAGGRSLNGLIKRRDSEARLFMKDPRNMTLFAGLTAPTEHELREMQDAARTIEQMRGKDMAESTTVWATIGLTVAGLTAVVREVVFTLQDISMFVPSRYMAPVTLVMVIAACAAWVIKERKKKADDDGI